MFALSNAPLLYFLIFSIKSMTHLPPKLKIIFAGTPEFATVPLRKLLEADYSVCAVYTQPDKPAGRGRKLTASPVKQLALENNIQVFQPSGLKSEDVQQALKSLQADIMVVVAYGLLLPADVLTIPRLGCINIHASLLPRWRGAAPIQRAILAGDTESGISIMQMDEGLDTGDVLAEAHCAIEPTDTASVLHDRLAILGGELLLKTLPVIGSGDAVKVRQDESKACYAAKIFKPEALINWSDSARYINNQVRAFNPWPVAYTKIKLAQADCQNLKIWHTSVVDTELEQPKPGTIVSIQKDAFDVAAGESILRVHKVQLPGGRAISVTDFLNAHQEFNTGYCFEH